ncbi:MAG: ferredoxin [Candidatus Buchananbacteria bacterium]|nr:ferredoxin [Candidatus Buchananbacteria bacterium]
MIRLTIGDDCIGCGTCEQICPQVFKIVEIEGRFICQIQEVDFDAFLADIDEAIEYCSTASIIKVISQQLVEV